MPYDKGHIIRTPKSCSCRTKPDYDPYLQNCPTCDWGLDVCEKCGGGEADLFGPCLSTTLDESISQPEARNAHGYPAGLAGGA